MSQGVLEKMACPEKKKTEVFSSELYFILFYGDISLGYIVCFFIEMIK